MSAERLDEICACGHRRRDHDDSRIDEGRLGCLGWCHCRGFQSEEADRLRAAISAHRTAIEQAGSVFVIWGRSRARRKHAADNRLWTVPEPEEKR